MPEISRTLVAFFGRSRIGVGLGAVTKRSRSAPAEFRSDVLEDAVEYVSVVVHTQLVRDREEQRIGHLDRLVGREFFDQHVGFRGVRAAEDGPPAAITLCPFSRSSAGSTA